MNQGLKHFGHHRDDRNRSIEYLSPVFGTGVTFASFQSCANLPVFKLQLKMEARLVAIELADVRRCAEIPS